MLLMLLTLLGTTTLLSSWQSVNPQPILVTLSGTSYPPVFALGYLISLLLLLSKRTPSALLKVGFCASTLKLVRLGQSTKGYGAWWSLSPRNIKFPRPRPIVTLAKEVQE